MKKTVTIDDVINFFGNDTKGFDEYYDSAMIVNDDPIVNEEATNLIIKYRKSTYDFEKEYYKNLIQQLAIVMIDLSIYFINIYDQIIMQKYNMPSIIKTLERIKTINQQLYELDESDELDEISL